MMRYMCRRYGIRKIHSSAYHPQGDGQSERSIQSFKTMLRCILDDRHIIHTNWPNLLQETTFILNSLPNASTALCPHEIMFGTQLRLPLDKWLPVADLNKHVEVQEYAIGVTPELESGPLFRTRPDPNPTIFNPNPTRTRRSSTRTRPEPEDLQPEPDPNPKCI